MTLSLMRLVCVWGLVCGFSLSFAGAAEVRLNGQTFTLPDGFTIEMAAAAPVTERPITIDFDEEGRLYAADSSGSNAPVKEQLADPTHRIFRLVDTNGDGVYDQQTLFADRMMFPEGTMWYDGSLYVSAPPSIWKLTDRDGDGVAEERVEWFQGKTLTGCANDLHGPYLGPDGWIYWCKGAFAEQTYPRVGKPPLVTKASHIFRARPDGSGIQSVMTGGMDNPVDVAFLPNGDRFLTTTFFQNPGGGNRDGIIHTLLGGLYGKVHNVLDGHERTSYDVLPVSVHLGPAAPCGLHRLASSRWGAEYRENLFACCFNLRKVTRHQLTPARESSSYDVQTTDFVVSDSLDFHPTDVMEDADGSLLIVDTGGWYKLCCPTSQLVKPDLLGAIYRVRRVGEPAVEDSRGLKLAWGKVSEAELVGRLGDERPVVRERARQALRKRGEAAVIAIREGFEFKAPAARVELVWTACGIDHPSAREFIRETLRDAAPTVLKVALHAVGVWRDLAAADAIPRLLENNSHGVPRAAADALAQCGDHRDTPALLKAFDEIRESDWATAHALTYALLQTAKAEDLPLEAGNSLARSAVLMAMEQIDPSRLPAETVLGCLEGGNSDLYRTADWVVRRHPEWGEQIAAYYERILRAPAVASSRVNEVTSQMAGVSTSPAMAAMLAQLLKDDSVSVEVHDRILTVMQTANAKPFPAAWTSALLTDLRRRGDSPSPVLAVIRNVPAADWGDNSAPLRELAVRKELPLAVRVGSLGAIPGGAKELSDEEFQLAVDALSSEGAEARSAGLSVLVAAGLSDSRRGRVVSLFKVCTPMELDRLVQTFTGTTNADLSKQALTELDTAPAVTSLRGDLIKTVFAKAGPEVEPLVERLVSRLNVDHAKQQARLEATVQALPAGDIRRGQVVFASKKLACIGCHAIGYVGGKIGPDLTRIGQIRSERDLLESILYPSASFVRSYEPVMIVTTSGLTHSGLVGWENAEEVSLVVKPDQNVRILRSEIEEMRPGTTSVMPAGLDTQLSMQELSDLVAFLRACK
jgi:putative membrane-bound dehydrogenase-like protein